jgi:TP901 family phage tail tape measure protein
MPTSIDDLISKLDALERKADSVGIKLNKLQTSKVASSLSGARDYLYSNNLVDRTLEPNTGDYRKVMYEFKKASNAVNAMINDLSDLSKVTRGINIPKKLNIGSISTGLLDISRMLDAVLNAGQVASRLSSIKQKNFVPEIWSSGLKINPSNLLYETRAMGNVTSGVSASYKTSADVFNPKSVSVTPRAGTKQVDDIIAIIYHEIGHALDEDLRKGNLSAEGNKRKNPLGMERGEFFQPEFYQQHMKPLLDLQTQIYTAEKKRMVSLGYGENDLVTINSANYKANTSEIFARNAASYLTTGKTENPELQEYMRQVLLNTSKEFRAFVLDIYKQAKQLRQDAAQTSVPLSVSSRLTRSVIPGLTEMASITESGEPESAPKRLRAELDAILSRSRAGTAATYGVTPAKATPQAGAPDYLNSYYKTLDEELQKKLTSYLTGKATGGTVSPERAREVARGILGGEITGGRVRMGGGSRVSLDSIMGEINKLIDNTITESLKIRKQQYAEWSLNNTLLTNPLFSQKGTKGDQAEMLGGVKKVVAGAGTTKKTWPPTATEKIAQQQQDVLLLKEIKRLEDEAAAAAVKGAREAAAAKQKINDQNALNIKYLEKQKAIDERAAQRITPPKTRADIEAQLGKLRSNRLLQFADQYGFTEEDLKKLYTQQPTGVTVGKFEHVDENTKAVSQLEVTVDKYGNTLTRTNKRLLGFTDAIVRNTQEVLRWSVGVGLVYGTMYRLQELVKVAIDNEAKLADIAVVLGDAQRDVNTIFDEAAKVAKDTGENINAVLETYTLAYRAVGAVKDPVEKANSAIQLLTDSTILNKLSSLDAASSIDVLAGSLRQLQKPGESAAEAFDRGRSLLDKWVTVSRKANVDLATLATAFSITSESAENSGVSIEDLNAIIASLAEKIGGLGGRETGNAVRALIGGIYQGQASEILTRYGIAVEDTTSKMRPFLDITREIYELNAAGIISSDELNKIGYVLGGGVRRGQQYVAFLSDFSRLQELANEQTSAAGAAQEALGRKLDTTQTSITKLNNAFQNLAQTLGTKGGVLDVANGLVKIFTSMVDVVELLTQTLGNMTIPAAVLGIMGLMFRGESGALKKDLFTAKVGGGISGVIQGAMGNRPTKGMEDYERLVGYTPIGQRVGQNVGAFASKNALGIIAGIYPAIQRALSDELVGKNKAIAVGADIGGAVIGTVLAGGSPIGGVLGAAIADTFVSATLAYKSDFENLFVDVFSTATNKTEEEQSELAKKKEAIITDIYKTAGGDVIGSAFEGMLRGRLTAFSFNLSQLFKTGQFGGMTPEQGALAYGVEKNPEIVGRIQEAKYETPLEITATQRELSTIEKDRIQLTETEARLLKEIANSAKERLVIESATGKIKPKQFVDIDEVISGLQETIPKLYEAFGEPFDKAEESISGLEETFLAFSDILQNSSEEDRTTLIQLTNELYDLYTGLELLKSGTAETFLFRGLETDATKATDFITEIETRVVGLTQLLYKEQAKAKFQLPTIIGMEDIKNMAGVEKLMVEARKNQAREINLSIEQGLIDERTAQLTVQEAEPIFIYLGDRLGYYLAKGITDTKYLTEAFDKIEEDIANISVDFQEFDFPMATVEKAAAQSIAMAQQWQKLYGYEPDLQEQIVIDSEGFAKVVKADWKITQYLLQQILDTEKKQLDGIYNLPEGAGFYVPYQTLGLAYQKGLNEAAGNVPTGEMGGVTNLPPYKEDTTTNLVKNTNEVINRALERDKQTEDVYKKASTTYLPYISVPPKMPPEIFSQKDRGDLIPPVQENWWDKIKGFFEDLPGIKWHENTIESPYDFKGLFDTMSQNLSTALNLNLNSTTTLIVDGRVLAEVVKNYLYQDMVRYENTAGAINRTIAI